MTKEEEKYTTLDTEQCKWWVNTLFSMAKSLACQTNNFDDAKEIQTTQDKIIETLEQQSNDCKIFGHKENCFGGATENECEHCDYKIQKLEQQPSDDKVTITMDKGTLKYSGKGYVVYNKDWFRKHFAIEVAIMTGYDGYIEQPTTKDFVSLEVYKQVVHERDAAIEQLKELGYSFGEKIRTSDDCVSRQAVDRLCFEYLKPNTDDNMAFYEHFLDLPPVTPTQSWIPLVWDEYPTVDIDGNDDYVYAVDYSVPMPNKDEWVLITDENHNVRVVQYDGYDFGDYVREEILAWKHLPNPYIE